MCKAHGCEGLVLLLGEPLQRRRQSTTTPAPAPPPISIHFVFRPCAGLSGGEAAPQACDSSLVPCWPSWTTDDREEFSDEVFRTEPDCVIFTSSLCAATSTFPVTSATSYCVRSLERGSTRMQFTCTLIAVEVPTETLPCSSVRNVPSNFTIVWGWMRTDEPSTSRLATKPGLVSSESPANMAVEPAISLPFTHTPPALRKIAEPVSAALSERGNRSSMTAEINLRRTGTLVPRLNCTHTNGNRSRGEPYRLLALRVRLSRYLVHFTTTRAKQTRSFRYADRLSWETRTCIAPNNADRFR